MIGADQEPIESRQGLVERMGRNTITGRAPSPLVTEMDVGDHRGPFADVDRRPFGRESPGFEGVQAISRYGLIHVL